MFFVIFLLMAPSAWSLESASLEDLVAASKNPRLVEKHEFAGVPYDAKETGLKPEEEKALAKPITIRYYKFHLSEEGKRPLVIVPGMREPAIKYIELARDFAARGYGPIYAADHRGQGISDVIRDIGDRDRTTHTLYLDKFDNYVLDLKKFIELVKSETGVAPDVFSHSMGGAVLALLKLKHSEVATGRTVYCSPMWDIKSTKAQIAKICSPGSRIAVLACQEPQGSPESKQIGNTHSDRRFALTADLMKANGIPTRALTAQWGKEALNATSEIRRLGAPPGSPLVLSGTDDNKVSISVHADLCKRAPYCQVKVIQGANHEIYQETDEIRWEALRTVFKFLDGQPLTPAIDGVSR